MNSPYARYGDGEKLLAIRGNKKNPASEERRGMDDKD